jgi:hypothetical protein
MCTLRWIRERLGLAAASGDTGNAALLSHFMRSLRDDYLYARNPTGEVPVDNAAIAQRIEALLNEQGDDWERAYEIQRLLVYIVCGSKLALELDRRLQEADRVKLPEAPKYRAQAEAVAATLSAAVTQAKSAAAAATVPSTEQVQRQAAANHAQTAADAAQADANNQRRAILAAVFDDLQWFYQKQNLVRKALYSSAHNLVAFGWITLMVAASPFFFFLIERQFGTQFFSKFLQHYPNYGLYTAASFGLVGAFFSRLLALKFSPLELTVEDAEKLFSVRSLIIRGAVGTCGAIILYFLLQSQIIGLAAPDLTKVAFKPVEIQTLLVKATVLLPSKDWALLVIWSVLAGFSEKLVPDSLSRAEARATAKQSS